MTNELLAEINQNMELQVPCPQAHMKYGFTSNLILSNAR